MKKKYSFTLFKSGIAATGTAAHVRALGCLPSKNMGALRPTTNKNNVTIS
jgi:hypothetical protein